MSKAYVFFATGYEEVEALTVVDLLRRAGIETEMISAADSLMVAGSHNITIKMDRMLSEISDDADLLVLPGGIPGTPNLKANEALDGLIREHNEKGKLLAAICAAPTVYGSKGLLKGIKAACYPGMEDELLGAAVCYDEVVYDANFVTSRGLGTAIPFGLKLVSILKDEKQAKELAGKIVFNH